MRVVVSRHTHELVISDMPGFAMPRRTLILRRFDYGQVPLVVVDLVIARLRDAIAQLDPAPWAMQEDLKLLTIGRDPNPPLL